MLGGEGNDRLLAGAGDVAEGGAGADAFLLLMFHADTIRIADFSAEEGDTVRMYGARDPNWNVETGDDHAAVVFHNGARVEFYGVSAAEIIDNPDLFGLWA